jgi:hypothetical protein
LGGFAPSFYVPFSDLGGGVVNIVPVFSAGDPTPTFSRASTAWTKLASGLWASVATGLPRFRYIGNNTVATTAGGYFPEPAATQLVTPTASIRDMTDASWVKVNVSAAKTATGIDGVANSASTITSSAINGTILQTLVAAASFRTYSAFVRRKTGVGTLTIQQGVTTLDVTALINSVTYTRVKLNSSTLNAAFGFTIGTSGDAFEVDFNQFEALASTKPEPTSPIDTAGATRAADSLTYPSAGNVDFTQGSAYAELSQDGANSGAGAVAATTNGRMLHTDAPTSIREFDGTINNIKAGLTDMSTGVRKRASSWGGTGQSVTGDGAAPGTGAFDGSMGSGAVIEIGMYSGANQWCGTIREARIFLLQNPDAWLQTVST